MEKVGLIVVAGGYDPVRSTLRLLREGGRYVFVGGGGAAKFSALMLGKGMLARPDKEDLAEIARMLATGAIEPLVGATFGLEGVADGVRLFESSSAHGKIVFQIGAPEARGSAAA